VELALVRDQITDAVEGFQSSKLIVAAVRMNLFPTLEEVPSTSSSLAYRLGLSERGTLGLLEGLMQMGLVTRNGDGIYAVPAEVAMCLGRGGHLSQWVKHQGTLYDLWEGLEQSARSGRPLLANTHDIDVPAYAWGLLEDYASSSPKLHEVVDLSGEIRVLDAGGGTGHYLIYAALANPSLVGVIFDKPEVAKIAVEAIKSFGLDSLGVVAGDLLVDPWPGLFDVILLANILHGKGEAGVRVLMDRAFGALREKGRLIIVEWQQGSSLRSALFNLTMLLCTEDGRVWPANSLEALAIITGFQKVEATMVNEDRYILVATK